MQMPAATSFRLPSAPSFIPQQSLPPQGEILPLSLRKPLCPRCWINVDLPKRLASLPYMSSVVARHFGYILPNVFNLTEPSGIAFRNETKFRLSWPLRHCLLFRFVCLCGERVYSTVERFKNSCTLLASSLASCLKSDGNWLLTGAVGWYCTDVLLPPLSTDLSPTKHSFLINVFHSTRFLCHFCPCYFEFTSFKDGRR